MIELLTSMFFLSFAIATMVWHIVIEGMVLYNKGFDGFVGFFLLVDVLILMILSHSYFSLFETKGDKND